MLALFLPWMTCFTLLASALVSSASLQITAYSPEGEGPALGYQDVARAKPQRLVRRVNQETALHGNRDRSPGGDLEDPASKRLRLGEAEAAGRERARPSIRDAETQTFDTTLSTRELLKLSMLNDFSQYPQDMRRIIAKRVYLYKLAQ